MTVREKETFVQAARRRVRIGRLNDQLRKTGIGGRIVVTRGVAALRGFDAAALLTVLRAEVTLDGGDDPYGKRDFGHFSYRGADLSWKIDYYNHELAAASPDPADPAVTQRVLTVLLAEEY